MSSDRPTDLRRALPLKPNSVARPGVHRFAADSKAGRRIAAETTHIHEGPGLTPEQQAWNAKIEARRLAKLARRRSGGEI